VLYVLYRTILYCTALQYAYSRPTSSISYTQERRSDSFLYCSVLSCAQADLFNEVHPNKSFPAKAPYWTYDAGENEKYNFRSATLRYTTRIPTPGPSPHSGCTTGVPPRLNSGCTSGGPCSGFCASPAPMGSHWQSAVLAHSHTLHLA